MTTLFIDYEHCSNLDFTTLSQAEFNRVNVFVTANSSKIPIDIVLVMQQLGDIAQYIKLDTSSKGSIAHLMAFHLGSIKSAEETIIVSRDTSVDTLVTHLCQQGMTIRRVNSISDAMPVAAMKVPNNMHLSIDELSRPPVILDSTGRKQA